MLELCGRIGAEGPNGVAGKLWKPAATCRMFGLIMAVISVRSSLNISELVTGHGQDSVTCKVTCKQTALQALVQEYTPSVVPHPAQLASSWDHGMAMTGVCCTMKLGSTAKVLAKCKPKSYRISECAGGAKPSWAQSQLGATRSQARPQ